MNDNKRHSDRRVKKTKKAIQDALMTLMDKKNISDITIIELTKEADVNRKTFYNHYSDIYQVMDEIENNLVEDLNKRTIGRLYSKVSCEHGKVRGQESDVS